MGGGAPEDMAQPGYKHQWAPSGRDDFGIMKQMGANFIRLYHPIGEEKGSQPDHGQLLDAAHSNGLLVFGAVHQYLSCDSDDCFDSWSSAVSEGLKAGFATGSTWHPAVWAINMINEVDAIIPFQAADRQIKRIISAVDGLLAAEQKAGVQGHVNLTSCFTTALAQPLGGGPSTIYHGFSSMEAWLKDTSLVDYKPRSKASLLDLAQDIDSRWVHCMNAQIPWRNGLDGMVANQYAKHFSRPWMVGEMGFNGQHQDTIQTELKTMHDFAQGPNYFLGSFFFQFQTAYQKTGAELNFGMFGLGSKTLGYSTEFFGKSFPVHCLTSRLYAFEHGSGCKDECNHRAQAVAKAFGGSLSGKGLCLDDAPLAPGIEALIV